MNKDLEAVLILSSLPKTIRVVPPLPSNYFADFLQYLQGTTPSHSTVASDLSLVECGKLYYVVESIKRMQTAAHGREFLVKWAGYPESKNSWEPESAFSTQSRDIIRNFYKQRRLRKRPTTTATQSNEKKCKL